MNSEKHEICAYTKTSHPQVKVCLTKEELTKAKAYAKSIGMTFQGWLGQIIREQTPKENENDRG